nr:MAG: sulfhydry1 oxidase Erv1-like protein [Diabrotica toursvirus 3a]
MDKYKSQDPNVWGEKYWFFLHSIAANYPENPSLLHKEVVANLIKGLPLLLPCRECATHAFNYIKHYIDDMDLIVENRKELELFFENFHNAVNIRIHKPVYHSSV